MDREEYIRMLNELVAEGMGIDDAHFFIAKKFEELGNKKYHPVCGLWVPRKESEKVAYESMALEEEKKIPKGAKLLVFYNRSDNEKAPPLRISWTW